jgi:hypothetical protein
MPSYLLGGVPASLPPMDDAGECGRGLWGSALFREFSSPNPPRPVDPASLYVGPGLPGCDCMVFQELLLLVLCVPAAVARMITSRQHSRRLDNTNTM